MSGKKCSSSGCPQAAFRDGLCIDHYKTAKPASSLVGAKGEEKITDDMRKKMKEITRGNYESQAKWYLNGFWTDGGENQAEEVWTITEAFVKLDPKKKNGNELDPVLSFHYLQGLGKPLTALELKEEMRRIDVDANGEMALLEYLLFKYNRLVTHCINNPQGGMDEESKRKLAEAEAKCLALAKAIEDLNAQLAQQKEAEQRAKEAEDHARAAEQKAREAEAVLKAAEDLVRKAEDEARAADAELKRQQDELENKKNELDAKTKNQSLGAVARNKAVQELAQLRGQDPLPLRKAKITQEAAVRKVEAERKRAEAARMPFTVKREAAEEERRKAEAARAAAEAETRKSEAALKDTEAKAQAAAEYLEEIKRQCATLPHGQIWWMERQVKEAKKYMPRSRQ